MQSPPRTNLSRTSERGFKSTSTSRRTHNLLGSLLIGLLLLHPSLQGNSLCPKVDSRCIRCGDEWCGACSFTQTPNDDDPNTTKHCTDKKITIANCRRQTEGSDLCYNCIEGYYLSDDLKSCKKGAIENCQRYIDSSPKTSLPHDHNVCQVCKEGFVPEDTKAKKCITLPKGKEKSNCRLYTVSQKTASDPVEYPCFECEGEYSTPNPNLGNSTNVGTCAKAGLKGCRIYLVGTDSKNYCSECLTFQNYFNTRDGCKFIAPPKSDDSKSDESKSGNLLKGALILILSACSLMA